MRKGLEYGRSCSQREKGTQLLNQDTSRRTNRPTFKFKLKICKNYSLVVLA
jgi:hypothetical protein